MLHDNILRNRLRALRATWHNQKVRVLSVQLSQYSDLWFDKSNSDTQKSPPAGRV